MNCSRTNLNLRRRRDPISFLNFENSARPKPRSRTHTLERFHGRLRNQYRNTTWFRNPWGSRRKVRASQPRYNPEWPHRSLGYGTLAKVCGNVPFALNDLDIALRIASQDCPPVQLREVPTLFSI